MAAISVRSGPVAAVERQFEALSLRDRRLFVGLVLFFVLICTGGFSWALNGLLDARVQRVVEAKAAFSQVAALESDFKRASALFATQESRLQQYSNQPVTAWVEDLAQKQGLNLGMLSVRQNKAETVGDIVQTRYSVDLKKAPQEPSIRFLHDIETSGFPARVEHASFKVAVVKKEKMLDMTLDLVVLSVQGE